MVFWSALFENWLQKRCESSRVVLNAERVSLGNLAFTVCILFFSHRLVSKLYSHLLILPLPESSLVPCLGICLLFVSSFLIFLIFNFVMILDSFSSIDSPHWSTSGFSSADSLSSWNCNLYFLNSTVFSSVILNIFLYY